jgi:hypothetical protein
MTNTVTKAIRLRWTPLSATYRPNQWCAQFRVFFSLDCCLDLFPVVVVVVLLQSKASRNGACTYTYISCVDIYSPILLSICFMVSCRAYPGASLNSEINKKAKGTHL